MAFALAALLLTAVAYFLWHPIVSPGALLVSAARDGRAGTVRLLLRLGTSPNQFRGKWSPALAAAWGGHTPVLRMLAAHDARFEVCEPEGYAPRLSPLSMAAARGHADAVRYLIAAGIPVDYQCGGAWPTPLAMASEQDHAAAVTALLELGADPGRNVDRHTHVMLAAARAASSVIPLLVRAGCDVNAKRQDGRTALMMTVDRQTAIALLNAGAGVNARDREGRTALLLLVEGAIWLHQHPDLSPSPYDPATLETLLQRGADPNIASAQGETPLDLAAHTGPHRTAIERLLLRHGATRRDARSGYNRPGDS